MTRFHLTTILGWLLPAFALFGQAYDLEDFESGDFSAHPWTFGSVGTPGNWTVTSADAHGGTFSAVAPAAQVDLESSYIEVTVDVTANNQISFWHKVSSELDFDFLFFYVNGKLLGTWSGITAWNQSTFGIFSGSNTFRWEYYKDFSLGEGDDVAWIDDIHFTGQTATEITVANLEGFVEIADGATLVMEAADGHNSSASLVVRNVGNETLNQTSPITITGSDAGSFVLTVQPTFPIGTPYLQDDLVVTFSPTTPGTKTATLTIYTDDADEGSYEINLQGTAYSFEQDYDGDGLNDASEFQMVALGFDWSVSQPHLVAALVDNVREAGLGYSVEDVANFYVGTPTLQADPGTGMVTLTIAPQSTQDLNSPFAPFAAAPSQVSVNGSGEIEFEFPMPAGKALFLLLESQ